MFSSAPRQPPRHVIGEETRSRLLAAAGDIFLRDGFRAARVEEIARSAGLRVSAINYHFGGKQGLYLAVLQQHAESALRRTPLAAPDPGPNLRRRFDFAISALVARLLDESRGGRISGFMLRELTNPTPALDILIERFSRPQAGQMLELLGEILGPAVDLETRRRCLVSIMGQCVIQVVGRPLIERIAPELLAGDDRVERTARHVAEFSWQALRAIRRSAERKSHVAR